jgi:hypothetical protein
MRDREGECERASQRSDLAHEQRSERTERKQGEGERQRRSIAAAFTAIHGSVTTREVAPIAGIVEKNASIRISFSISNER